MAVTNTKSNEVLAAESPTGRNYPVSDHGKMRSLYCKVVQGAAAGDATSTLELFDLPPGRVRIWPQEIRVKCTALGAARTLVIGHKAYSSTGKMTGDTAADDDAFSTAIDVAAAGIKSGVSTALKFDIYSADGVRVFGTIGGGTIPAAAEIEVFLPYTYE